MNKLQVELGERSYPIYIGRQLISDSQFYTPHIRGSQVLVISNETVAPLYLGAVRHALSDYQLNEVILPDGEQFKTMDVLNHIFDGLLSHQHNRSTTLVALGGGVIGDMTGFAAACYQRGVDFIQVPTTLLSQVDSSVGGKTAVNHPLGKNMIGAFHQPRCVIADTDTLETLPDRELSAGLAEVIKYGLICDQAFYQWLAGNMESLLARNADALAYAIQVSCQNKADVVAEDEKESGIRAILNLGHTFGHAIEAHQGYGQWLHGEAVAAGMLMAADLSQRLGWLASSDVDALRSLLQQASLPVLGPANMDDDDYLSRMQVDKKVLDGQLRLVLLQSIGKALVTSDVPREQIIRTLSACRA
ncbi:3-dehydroquinate synthase [Bacterioplanes sanyensis]|uniref:3-dehydroquinate synthase n=1 Tax=Bacterioplanes sanyensis TaxID=1249553 RepID=A0A222FEE8_9GAMM|nr:3-dehydroquinate synthase [Bacterioplanes sanyensis]ASP37465.1 3-dehydroquinate synthase [Bacterioplanes sanyensis]